MLLVVAPAWAGTYTLNFDSVSAGTTVNSGPAGLTMPQHPVTFNASGNTQSNPNALRLPGDCPNSGEACTTGDHRLVMNFSSPARSVSMRVGTVVPGTCFELDCPNVRLVGYDDEGHVVAENVPSPEYVPEDTITHPVSVDAHAHSIAKAIYVVNGDPLTGSPIGDLSQWTAQVDDLTYDVLEGGDPPPPPPPAAPSVSISDPSPGDTFASTDINVKGDVSAPAGLSRFCVVANGGASIPSDCNAAPNVAADGSFSVLRVRGMRPGPNTVRAWARDAVGRVASATVQVSVADGDVDFVTRRIEINQAVQVTDDARLTLERDIVTFDYAGVPLSEDKTTIVRLYGAARGAAPGGVRGTTAFLWGFLVSPDGTERPLSEGAPLRPVFSPRRLEADPDLARLRADEGGSFNFVLPSSWTRSRTARLKLVGEVAPPSVSTDVRGCCPGNNAQALRGIPFSDTRTATLYPVGVIENGRSNVGPTTPLADYFETMKVLWPGRLTIAPPIDPDLDLTAVGDRVRASGADGDPDNDLNYHGEMFAELEQLYGDLRIHGKIIGLMGGGGCAGEGHSRIAVFDTNCANNEIFIVSHESGHTLGLKHAHSPDDDTFDCPTARTADRGLVQGIGLDTRLYSGSGVGRFEPVGAEQAGVFDAEPDDAPPEVYDYMSYCGRPGANSPPPGLGWVSTPYWASTLRALRPGGGLDLGFSGRCCYLTGASDPTVSSAASDAAVHRDSPSGTNAAARQSTIRVSGLLEPDGNGGRILRVEPGRGRPRDYMAEGGGPRVRVVVKNAGGEVISDTEVSSQASERHPSEPLEPNYVDAAVPSAPGAASVEILREGALLAQRSASANAPTVKLRRPKRGQRIGRRRFKVTWKASDADGDPLTSRLEFSSDAGRTWRGVTANSSGRRARVRGAVLPKTNKGILRVVVSDGFNVDRSQVTRIRSKGSKPEATITIPRDRKLKVLGDTNLRLEGQAFDDRGKAISGKRLRWISKRRRIGKGATLDVPVYKLAGTVKLVATDYAGRRGADRLKLRVKKVAPLFTTLMARKLSRKSRKLKLKLASTLPGRVKLSGKGVKRKSAKVTPKRAKVKTRLRGKRRRSYDVKLKLRAGGKTTRERLTVIRR